mgnify:CR=1 FL=1
MGRKKNNQSKILKNKIKPYKFQRKGIRQMKYKFDGRVLLADDPGLGKTLQSILAATRFRAKRPIIVVCPSGVKYQWEAEVKKLTRLNCWVLEGRKPPKRMPLELPAVIIINWEILPYWVAKLKRLKPRVIIGDEIHYAKNRKAKRSKALKKLSAGVKFIFFLSGTPFENNPIELFHSVNILRPDIFQNAYAFGMRYCNPKYTPWGIKFDGATRRKELRRILLKHCMIRRTKEEVIKDLPRLTRTVVPLEIDRKKYKKAEKNIVRWLLKNKPEKAYKVRYINQLAKLNYLLQLVSELKLKETMKWIDNFLQTSDEKLCVFGYHREFLEKLHKKYKKQAVLRYGNMTKKKRREVLDKFIAKKKIRIFIGSIPAVGTGTDRLQRVCSNMAVVELIWTGVKLLQVEGRLHRLGQKNPVNIYYLVSEDTVESMLCKAIMKKQKDFNMIISGKKSSEDSEFDVLETILKKLKKRS